jgi:p-cumate 2,3-dioxygenase subunit beta
MSGAAGEGKALTAAPGETASSAGGVPATQENLLLRLAVEHFLWEEAAHLDNWRLDAWLALFADDARYVVPATDAPDGDPDRDMMMIDDDLPRLRARVTRLKGRYAHSEFPYSRTRHVISNVRLTRVAGDEVEAEAAFIVYRMRMGGVATYVGLYRYVLARQHGGGFKIQLRRAQLDLEGLREHGTVSMIL